MEATSKTDRYVALRNLEKMCKAEADALQPDVEDEAREDWEAKHIRSRAGFFNGIETGTLSSRISKPREAVIENELRVTDREAFADWCEANAAQVARAVIEQDEAARLVAGYVLITCGEVPQGCEFVEYVAKPASEGGKFLGITCTTKPENLLAALPQFAGVLTNGD